jgi:hypothetical protein
LAAGETRVADRRYYWHAIAATKELEVHWQYSIDIQIEGLTVSGQLPDDITSMDAIGELPRALN